MELEDWSYDVHWYCPIRLYVIIHPSFQSHTFTRAQAWERIKCLVRARCNSVLCQEEKSAGCDGPLPPQRGHNCEERTADGVRKSSSCSTHMYVEANETGLYLGGLNRAIMVWLVDHVIDNHLGDLPCHLLLGLDGKSWRVWINHATWTDVVVGLNTCYAERHHEPQTAESFMNIWTSHSLTSSELPWTHFFIAWENMEPTTEEEGRLSEMKGLHQWAQILTKSWHWMLQTAEIILCAFFKG